MANQQPAPQAPTKDEEPIEALPATDPLSRLINPPQDGSPVAKPSKKLPPIGSPGRPNWESQRAPSPWRTPPATPDQI